MTVNWKHVARDTAILYVLTFLGGFIIGLSGAQGPSAGIAIGVSNLIFTVIGFTISGSMAKTRRFNHLFPVAIAFWLVSLSNVLLGAQLFHWFLSIIFILISMGIGGALSFLFVREN